MNNMHEILNNQKKFYLENGAPSYELRIDRLNRVKDIVLTNKDRICLLYTSPSPRDDISSRMPSSA